MSLLLALLAPAHAEDPAFVPEVQFRPRYEADTGRDGDGAEDAVHYVTHRARMGGTMDFDRFAVRLVFQDARAWGEELDTRRDFSGDGIDLAIGTFRWTPTDALTLTLGRDEVSLHDERLVARANWRQPGRHFDGGRLTLDDGTWAAEIAGFIAVDGDTFDFANTDQFQPGVGDQTLWWARAGRETEALTAQALVVVDDRRNIPGSEILRLTPGVFAKGTTGSFTGRFEGYGQLGSSAGGNASIAAFMVGASGLFAPEVGAKPTVELAWDMLSGDGDPGDDVFSAFDPIRGANHRYYGHIDMAVFLRGGPSDGRGLHDGQIKLAAQPVDRVTVALDNHLFLAAARADEGQLPAYEPDARVIVRAHDAVKTTVGASTWLPLSGDGDPDFFAYAMLDVLWKGPRLPNAPVERDDVDPG